MHYYQFNIGNYRRDTMHLSLVEHAIYRSLIDTYYLEEKPLCDCIAKLMRTHCVRSADEEKALKNVLSDYFIHDKDAGVYRHPDIDEHLAKYAEKSDKARKSAQSRWKKCEGNANAMRTHSEGNANHKPITNNQEPITNSKKSKPKKASRFSAPTLEQVVEYCNQRANNVDANKFIDFYESKGWMVGSNKMKDWKAAVRNWERSSSKQNKNTHESWKQNLIDSDYTDLLGE